MGWNLENIRFLHPPDDFTGSFTNEKMQARHLAMQKAKITEITTGLENETHPIKAMHILNRKEYVQFVKNNLDEFKKQGCFEKAVLSLYFHKNTPFASAGSFDTWNYFFEQCDKSLLFEQGKPLPAIPIRAYRGSVTGLSKGFSWTVDLEKVNWILNRWQDKELGGGSVFYVDLSEKDIIVYIEDDERKEVIVTPEIATGLTAQEVKSI